jgi:hypothetical protein
MAVRARRWDAGNRVAVTAAADLALITMGKSRKIT